MLRDRRSRDPRLRQIIRSGLQFTYLAEMVTVDSQSDRQRQKLRTSEKSPHHQVPVLYPFFTKYADSDGGSKKRQKALEVDRDGNLGGFILP